jgi:hypothetical protein
MIPTSATVKGPPPPSVSLTLAAPDGTSTVVSVPGNATVREVKRAVERRRGGSVRATSIDLFIAGDEDPLPDAKCIGAAGLGLQDKALLFMLQRPEGWVWTDSATDIQLSAEEPGSDALRVARKMAAWSGGRDGRNHLVTGGEVMRFGRHYWEVRVASYPERARLAMPSVAGVEDEDEAAKVPAGADACQIFVGAVRPGLDHNQAHERTDDAFFVSGFDGTLWGNLRSGEPDGQVYDLQRAVGEDGGFNQGDRVGVELDLDAGHMRFYRNGTRCGPGFASGVTGPLVRAAGLFTEGTVVTALDPSSPPAPVGAEAVGQGQGAPSAPRQQVWDPWQWG